MPFVNKKSFGAKEASIRTVYAYFLLIIAYVINKIAIEIAFPYSTDLKNSICLLIGTISWGIIMLLNLGITVIYATIRKQKNKAASLNDIESTGLTSLFFLIICLMIANDNDILHNINFYTVGAIFILYSAIIINLAIWHSYKTQKKKIMVHRKLPIIMLAYFILCCGGYAIICVSGGGTEEAFMTQPQYIQAFLLCIVILAAQTCYMFFVSSFIFTLLCRFQNDTSQNLFVQQPTSQILWLPICSSIILVLFSILFT